MEAFSALPALFARNSPVTGEFLTQRPVTWRLDVFFDLPLNKRLSKQSWGWWFETPSRSLWWHSKWNATEPHRWLINIGSRNDMVPSGLNQCWPSFTKPYGGTGSQWLNISPVFLCGNLGRLFAQQYVNGNYGAEMSSVTDNTVRWGVYFETEM